MSAIPTRGLADCPVFITNMVELMDAALDILHEMERDQVPTRELREMDRAVAMLSVCRAAAEMFVAAVAAGPDYAGYTAGGSS